MNAIDHIAADEYIQMLKPKPLFSMECLQSFESISHITQYFKWKLPKLSRLSQKAAIIAQFELPREGR